ncbi:MAG TPA: TIM-barrel domain-containing protein [Verrucomicrobiae bacterium]|nr:TIM-barrel domain-containing protein [Verrucomicrobiae bacterium]
MFARWTLISLLLVLSLRAFAAGDKQLQVFGAPVQLTISEASERTVRIELTPLDEQGNPCSGTPSTVLAQFQCKERFRARELASEKKLRIGKLRVAIKPNPLTISVTQADGKPVQELVFDDANGTNAVTFRADAPVLGLGEGEQQFDRRGHYFRMRNGQIAPLLATHGATIPVPFLIGTDGWALFFNRTWGEFDLREAKARFLPVTNAIGCEPLEIFVINVREPAGVFTEYVRLTGQPVMPPKWTMGYIQSHRTLLGPDDPLQIAKTFREKNLPCDALIYLGTGYCTNGWNVVNGTIDFNTNAFPRPAEQIKALQAENFKVILHVNQAPRNLFGTTVGGPLSQSPSNHPKISAGQRSEKDDGKSLSAAKLWEKPAETGANLFSRGPYLTRDERQALGTPVVTGMAKDFDSPLHIRNYWQWHRPVFALGIDGWWPDDGDELPIEARLARHRCYYEGPLLERPNERPWSLHRNGYAGVARYGGWIWSGDPQSRWATLAAHVPVGLNYSLSVSPFWGTDIGGFVITSELTGELYVRWFQFGAFNPLFRSHGRTWHLRLPWGWNTGETGPIESRDVTDRAELRNAEVEPICRKYLELRYRLLPYNYSLVREACDRGLPMMRALWLHYPDDAEAVKLGGEYLWGRDVLVAPVVEKGATTRRVYLPEGTWFDWWTGKQHPGKQWIERPVDLATLPLYVRAGAIIPFDPIRQFTAQSVSEPPTVLVFPGANGEFTLYDDDGQSLAYRTANDPKATWIRFRWDDAKRRLTIEPDKRMKKWPGGRREFAFKALGSNLEPKRIEFQGKRVVVNL